MKAMLEFNLPEENIEFKHAVDGSKAHAALCDIQDEVFRPARKHGYPDKDIAEILEKIESSSPNKYLGEELIRLLEDKFIEILDVYNIETL